MSKNIVVLIDGTGNEISANETNVLKLAQCLVGDPKIQSFHYDPGVGTQGLPTTEAIDPRALVKIAGLTAGLGLYARIADAYRFLMRTYEGDDKIYLFGFSRGAYAARALAGLIGKVGLLEPGRDNLIPYALKLYADVNDLALSRGFTRTFCPATPDIAFLGLWDTVKSVIQVESSPPSLRNLSLPRTFDNDAVRVVRHALAIDERRRFFRTNMWSEAPKAQHTDVKQVWFPGVHSDVGGGYPEPESGLSSIAFAWMVRDARAAGLLIDQDRLAAFVPPTSISGDTKSPPIGKPHDSLRGFWWIPEIVPQISWSDLKGARHRGFRLPLGMPRYIPENSILHQSVVDRLNSDTAYRPANLPEVFQVERN